MMDIIFSSDFCILYKPLVGEIDPALLPHKLPSRQVIVPNISVPDPKIFGRSMKEQFENLKCVILIPGRKFDKFGGRHGRGGGWYDRFLSVIPAHWIRIGICSEGEFSSTKLILQPWDEFMDGIIVSNGKSFSFHKTNARFC